MLRLPGSTLILVEALAVAAVISPAVTALTPLNDLADGLYLNQFQGGLYRDGSNEMPATHAAEGIARARLIRPRNTLGALDAAGKNVLVSIGMSNTTQEFCGANEPSNCRSWTFMGQAASQPDVEDSSLFIVNGAAGGKSAAYWDSPTDPDYDRVVTDWLTPNGLSEKQVQAAWVKVANPGPTISLPNANADAYRLVEQMGDIARSLKVRYPNMQQVYFSSRIYAGYATTQLNPEPYAYESGFAVKWLIEAQINQMNGGGIDPLAGDLDYTSGIAPWIAWGPYLWADGLNPRSDGLVWERIDLANDGTHPSTSGERKVGTMLLDFMLDSEFTRPWFVKSVPGDFNGDGTVDTADYVTWRNDLGTVYTQDDFDTWRAHFGQSLNNAAFTNGTIPEPTAWIMMTIAISINCHRLTTRTRTPFQ